MTNPIALPDRPPLPPSLDLQIRRHLEAILELLRPRCTRCQHPISAAKSIRLGMGPDCRGLSEKRCK